MNNTHFDEVLNCFYYYSHHHYIMRLGAWFGSSCLYVGRLTAVILTFIIRGDSSTLTGMTLPVHRV